MGVAENKQLLQHIFAELLKGNAEPYLASLADDIRWTIIGTTKFSGTFHGKQAVFNELLEPVLSQIAAPLTLMAHRFIAEGDHVVVEFHGQNTTKAGKVYNNTYCCIYHIAEGKVHEVTEYLDTELVTAAFGR
jgi:uncharacterized protein